MSKNREALVEVSSDGDSLLSFRAEGEQTLQLAVRPAPPVGALVHRRVRASTRRARSGWANGLLLFVSGLIAGVLVAILSSEWPEGAQDAIVSGKSPSNGIAAVAPAVSAIPLPVGTSSPATSTASPSVAKAAEQPTANRSPGFRGTLMVTSQPRGASIFLNDRLVGRTPLRIGALPAGSRAVRLRLDGYQPWSRGVNIVANQSTTVSARLTPDKTSR